MHAATYDVHLKDAKLAGSEQGQFTIWVPNVYARDWLEKRLYRLIQQTLCSIAGTAIELNFIAGEMIERTTEAEEVQTV